MNYPRINLPRPARFAPALLALAALAAMSAPAAAQTAAPNRAPSANGKIAYTSNEQNRTTGADQIWVMNADGKHKTRLTNSQADDNGPAFSPDGKYIAFYRDDNTARRIMVMNADGTNLRAVSTPLNFSASKIEWSPNGRSVKCEYAIASTTYVVPVFTDDAGTASSAAWFIIGTGSFNASADARWSPDGSKLVYSKFGAIYTINADGTGETPLTAATGVQFPRPAWSPDGTRVAFAAMSFDNTNVEIFVMNAVAGATRVNATETATEDESAPEWSPDGTRIAFITSDGAGTAGVAFVSPPAPAASAVTRLADINASDQISLNSNKLVWSPDGTMIAYQDETVTNKDGISSQDIMVVETDGSRASNNTRTRQYAEFLGNWQKAQ